MTKKLYYDSAYIKEFDASVISCIPLGEHRYGIILEQTGFYPEGGGQPSDTGFLNDCRVLDVHEKDGEIVHTTDGFLIPGSTVHGMIDWEPRYENMQHHSGEHLLSGLIHKALGYDNVGFHMGKDEVTIDFNGPITPQQLQQLETEANEKIYQNIPIEIIYPGKEELDSMDYRSKKEISGQIRIVMINEGDTCACCGTHVLTTGEIGMIKTLSMINYKGGVRITMVCGLKALKDYQKKQGWLSGLSNSLSAKPEAIVDAVDRIKQDNVSKDVQINRLYQKLFRFHADALPSANQPLLLFEEELAPVQLRQLCTLIYQEGKGNPVLVCSKKEQLYQYAMGSPDMDMRDLAKELNRQLSGKGGGSRLLVQGTFDAEKEKIKEVFDALHRGE